MSEIDQQINESPGILAGVRVVELGHRLAAPLLGMLLAEQGAEVVRVVDPHRPPTDPVLDALLARGKTELRLAADRPDDLGLLHRLLGQADLVLEDGEGELGIDFDAIRAADNPGLTSCRLPAFADEDPRARLPGHEAVAGAAGYLYTKPLGRPRYHDFPIGSVTAALYAAGAVVAALFARDKTGRGQRIEVPLQHANLTSQAVQILVKAGVPRGFLPLKMIGSPFMRCWRCGDGRYVYLHITLPGHNAQMLEILEQRGYAAEVGRLRKVMSKETMRDPSQVKSIKEAKKIKAIYAEIFKAKAAGEWEAILGGELCCIKVRKVEEWLRDSLEAGMTDACEVDDPVFGKLLGPGACVAAAAGCANPRPGSRRRPGASVGTRPAVAAPDHPPRIAPRRLGEPAPIADRWEAVPRPTSIPEDKRGVELRHPLQGVKVLDLSRIIAGPCAARTLAELGADVISIQSETRLDWALSFHLMFNAGKRSVTLDFTDDAGKQRLWQLIDWYKPDALIHNYRHLDLARTIGVGPEDVHARYPGLAYTHLNAYGNHGVWQHRPGFEQVVQAVSGIQTAYAEGERPKLLPSPIIDIGCGLLGAFGTLLGLYHQRRTGEGVVATTHLTSVSVLLQLLSVSAFQREACLSRARGEAAASEGFARYDADREVVADVFWTLGTFALLCGPRRDLRRWLVSAGLAAEAEARGRELEVAGKRLGRRPVAHWQRTLVEAGVEDRVAILPYPGVRHAVKDVRRYDSRPDPALARRHYPGSPRDLVFIQNPVRMSPSELVYVDPPPLRGADTGAVLREAGIDGAAADAGAPYPPSKSLPVWLASFVRWGYFAWKSGNI